LLLSEKEFKLQNAEEKVIRETLGARGSNAVCNLQIGTAICLT
jgi:hypothetical protein